VAEELEVEGTEFSAVIASEIRAARSYDRTELSNRRALAIEYMRGVMRDTPAPAGRFSQSSRVFPDTVAWLLPQIVRVFTASDQFVQYDKVKADSDDWSRDATEYTNYSFFRENNGYRILYNATYDSLVMGNGLACAYWEPPRVETKWFRNKTELEIADLLNEGWQPTGVMKPGKPKTDGDFEVETISAKLQRQERAGKICDTTCKPENLLLNPTATEIETARFCAYLHDDKTRSDLLEMADDYGWDKSRIEELAAHGTRQSEREVTEAREGDRVVDYSSPVKSGDPIDLYECYVRVDRDGDGIAELMQVWWAGGSENGVLLGEEEWEGDVPYTDIPCYPVPHRWDAQSVFDRTHDITQVNTILLRALLDNTAASTFPLREVEDGSVINTDILVNPKFGGIIWKKKNSAPIVNYAPAYTGDKTLAAMEYMDEMVAKRTGVSRSTMALDPETLQNQTATAAQQQRDASVSQVELIARNMAELGWAKYFSKRLKLATKHGIVREVPSNRGEAIVGPDGQPTGETTGFRTIDASKWDPNMAVSINVGLGTGSRDRDLAMLNQIILGQRAMAQELGMAGLADKALEFIPKIRTTAVRIAESAGLKNPEEYYPEFTDEDLMKAKAEAAQPKPDPKIELEKERAQADIAIQQQKARVDAEADMRKFELERFKAESEIQIRRDQIAAEMQLKRDQLAAELQLKREQLAAELALKRELGLTNAAVKASTSEVRPGGDPG
jgi:hypothetical protein